MWRKAVVDLTALLDVILIMLFLVLTNASAGVEEVQRQAALQEEQMAAVQAEKTALQTENQRLQREVDGLHFLDAHMHMVSVHVQRDPDGSRMVFVESGAQTKQYPLNWNNVAAVRTALDAELARICGENGDGQQLYLLLFRYDRSTIYQADYAMIRDVLMRRKNLGGNVYSAEYDIREDDRDG